MKVATARQRVISRGSDRARQKFLRFFPAGFRDETYIAWERGYKWRAHERWTDMLDRRTFRRLLSAGEFDEIAARSLKSLTGTNLLFSFESMALRDAVKSKSGAKTFAVGLYEFLYERSALSRRFNEWCARLESLPKKQSRVFTHPVATVFGFIAEPRSHIFFKPTVTKTAAERYGFDLLYQSRPSSETYQSVLQFASVVAADLRDLRPRDMIDIQSFIWVNGSAEYE